MALEHLFQGSALNAVDAKGRVSVPAFLRSVIERRGDENREPILKMGAQVLSEDGRPVGDGLISLVGKGPVEPDGRQLLLVSFTPERLSPGRYSLRVILQDGATGRGTHASAPFRVP